MISEVRRAAQRLGEAGVEELRAETGLLRDHVAQAVDFLVERGYLVPKAAPADSSPAPSDGCEERSRAHCKGCPVYAVCTPRRGQRPATPEREVVYVCVDPPQSQVLDAS